MYVRSPRKSKNGHASIRSENRSGTTGRTVLALLPAAGYVQVVDAIRSTGTPQCLHRRVGSQSLPLTKPPAPCGAIHAAYKGHTTVSQSVASDILMFADLLCESRTRMFVEGILTSSSLLCLGISSLQIVSRKLNVRCMRRIHFYWSDLH